MCYFADVPSLYVSFGIHVHLSWPLAMIFFQPYAFSALRQRRNYIFMCTKHCDDHIEWCDIFRARMLTKIHEVWNLNSSGWTFAEKIT
jgi:hypothetical protein